MADPRRDGASAPPSVHVSPNRVVRPTCVASILGFNYRICKENVVTLKIAYEVLNTDQGEIPERGQVLFVPMGIYWPLCH